MCANGTYEHFKQACDTEYYDFLFSQVIIQDVTLWDGSTPVHLLDELMEVFIKVAASNGVSGYDKASIVKDYVFPEVREEFHKMSDNEFDYFFTLWKKEKGIN